MQQLIETIAQLYGLTVADLRGPSRVQYVADARHAAAWALRHAYPTLSLQEIGRLLGGRDHTTIINSIERADARMKDDPVFAADLRALVTPPPALPSRRHLRPSQGMRWWVNAGRTNYVVMAA